MKQLYDILNECDGATPGNTMGMGNVMVPAGFDGEEGSGDIPNAGGTAKSKKQKRRKKDLHPKDKGEDLKLEGLFSQDIEEVEPEDSFWMDVFKRILNSKGARDHEYVQAYEALRAYCEIKDSKPTHTVMKNFRSKEHTIISFIEFKDNFGDVSNRVEFRRFIKNPLPFAIDFYVKNGRPRCVARRVNHPQLPLDYKKRADYYMLPVDIWDDLTQGLVF